MFGNCRKKKEWLCYLIEKKYDFVASQSDIFIAHVLPECMKKFTRHKIHI